MGGRHVGKVAFAKTRAGVVGGVFLDWDESRGHVLLEDGRREVWTEERLVWVSEARIPLHSPVAAREALLGFCERVREVMVDLAALWDLVAVEGGEWSVEDLADLAYPRASCEHRAALACALASDAIFFRVASSPGRFKPHTREAVEQALLRRQREEQEDALVNRATAAVEKALAGESTGTSRDPDSVWGSSEPLDERSLAMGIEWLKALVVDGEGDRAGMRGARLVRSVLGEDVRDATAQAFHILVRLGVFHEDEVLGLHRHRIALDFPPEVEAEAAQVAALFPALCEDSRRPVLEPGYGQVGPLAVDDPWTTEVDDALWVEEVGTTPGAREPEAEGLVRVHVLIADPSCGIGIGSGVAAEGMARAATLYLPNRKIPMFPQILSEQVFSLVPGERRPMMDFCGEFDAAGHLVTFRITPVWAVLDRRLTYDEVDSLLAEPEGRDPLGRSLRILSRLASTLRRRREEAGAVLVERDDVSVRVVDGEVRVRRLQASPARRLVAEFMVFACTQAGRFAREHGIPVVYRRQGPPDGPLPPDLVPGSKAWAYRMLRAMKRAELTVHPEPHFGLGVIGYTQVTSPLRRFQDFVVHVQLKGFLHDGRAPLDSNHILTMFGDLEGRAEARIQVEREARRYFLLKYLKKFEGSEVAGEVVATQGHRAVVELSETGVEVAVNGAGHLPLGSEVRLRVLDVQPRRDRISVRLA